MGPAALLLMVASGFASLGYQIVWTQQHALWLGHESAALLASLGAFFGGLAVGAWSLGPRIERSARPAWWYVGCELAVASWGVVWLLAARPISEVALRAIGETPSPFRHWAMAFYCTFALLL